MYLLSLRLFFFHLCFNTVVASRIKTKEKRELYNGDYVHHEYSDASSFYKDSMFNSCLLNE